MHLEEILGAIYEEIYKKAEPYWETRKNNIHVPISYDFARRLLSHYPEADEDIVLPATLLHDVGWKMVPEEMQLDGFGPRIKDKQVTRLHEVEGAKIANDILVSLDYDEEKTREILAIVEGHDSRREVVSLNDKLVRDADKLWRFTATGINIDVKRFGIARDTHLDYLEGAIDGWFFTPEARDMARELLDEARKGQGP